ncbi:MobC family plasmid mobilization relaxosome protein [Arsenicicoccus bolidensis]|uniref:MobC family plasmid mobilization relaxosome protein n=1 Tax=Arsenicicoccus bolidensis TaxID=229480 RepID=UPI000417186B|nr:MobC family plasmid mobilization relaxosome protein [Arsenicicoccus bolidensis]
MSDDVERVGAERKPSRRRRVEGGRQHRHVVRVTPEEEAQLLRLALRYRVSVPKLLVDSALAGGSEAAAESATTRAALLTELFGVHRLLANIANNVNQIAKAANSTGDMPTQTPEVLAAVRRVAERIDALVDRLSS